MIKIFVVVFFIFIIASLANAFYHLVRPKDEQHSAKTVKALTYRISLSLILFLLLFLAVASGILQPHGIGSVILKSSQTQLPTPNP